MRTKISEKILQYSEKVSKEPYLNQIKNDYYYFIYPYSIFVETEIANIIKDFPQLSLYDKNTFICDISYQIIAYAKPKLFNNLILHEFSLLRKENMLDGMDEQEQLSTYVTKISNNKDWIKYFFSKYPLFDTLLSNFTYNTLEYIKELLQNYITDKAQFIHIGIENLILKRIELFKGDLHGLCKSVCFFEFENHSKIIYKPRTCCNEKAILTFYNITKEKGLNLNFKIPQYINCHNHSWHQFITPKEILDKDKITDYYYNLGQFLCFCYIIGITDIIPDNIISSEGIPYLIDVESIFSKNSNAIINSEIFEYYNQSVAKVGILPTFILSDINHRNYICSVLFKKNKNTHLPQYNNQYIEITPNLLKYFISGFSLAYKFFQHTKFSKKELTNFALTNNRQILHATLVYETIFKEFMMPEFMSKHKSIKQYIEIIIPKNQIEYKNNIIQSIYNQFLQSSIPAFYTDGNSGDLIDALGNNIFQEYNYNNLIAIEHIEKKINLLSLKKLNEQSNIIKSSIIGIFELKQKKYYSENVFLKYSYQSKAPKEESNLQEAAMKIGNFLLNNMITYKGKYGWIHKTRNPIDGRYETLPLGNDLYDGTTGIVLLFYYLFKYSSNNNFLSVTNKIINDLKKQFYTLKNNNYYSQIDHKIKEQTNITPFAYPLSLLYLIQHLPKTCQDIELLNDIINELRKNIIRYSTNFEYLKGIFGFVNFLIDNPYKTHILDYYSILEESIAIILKQAHQTKKYVYWTYIDSFNNNKLSRLGGFAHGASGTMYVLYKLYIETNNKLFLTLSKKALNFDRSFYNKEILGWRDGREVDNNFKYDSSSWCHGSGGIALSRLLLLNTELQDDLFDYELTIAAQNLIKSIGHNQCICHGDMGNLEILKSIGNHLNDNKIIQITNNTVNQIANQIVKGKKIKCGDNGICGLFGLFMGYAGVGYQLLRINNWHEMPSLLCLETSPTNNILHQQSVIKRTH